MNEFVQRAITESGAERGQLKPLTRRLPISACTVILGDLHQGGTGSMAVNSHSVSLILHTVLASKMGIMTLPGLDPSI